MRKITILIITILASQLISAQEVKKVKNFNDRARTTEIYHVLKHNNEVRQGEYVFKYNGVTQVKGQFENNYADGKWLYKPGKSFRIEGNFNKGKKSGVWTYYKNDKLISEINYYDGVLNGKAKGYYENGKLACDANYDNGKFNGEYRAYYPNGKAKEISFYKIGKLDGNLKRFNDQGDLLYSIKYRMGVPFDVEIFQDKQEIYYGGTLKNGTGEFIEYAINHENDKKYIANVITFKDGKLNGSAKGYDLNGELFYRGQYMDGYMIGMWEFYLNNKKKYFNQVYNFADSLKEDTTKWFIKKYKDNIELFGELPKFANKDVNQFRYHIANTLVYPRIDQEFGISGRVYVEFTVSELGLVQDVKLLNSVDKHLDLEALRVVKTSPLWVPGFKDQLPVEVKFTFPIVFQLR